MKILITGSTGFIGQNLTNELLRDGNEITVLSTRPGKAELYFDQPVHSIGYETEKSELSEILSGCQAVINLAGAGMADKRWTREYKKTLKESRVGTTEILAEAIAAASGKPEVFIQGSAIGYYGNHPENSFTEDSPKGEGFVANLVDDWEKAAEPLQDMGIRVVWTRSGVVMGRHEGMLGRLELPYRLFAGGHPGDGKQWLSWIDLRDEIKAIRFLMETPDLSGKFNLTSPNPMQMKDYLKIFGKVLNRPSWAPLPRPLLKMIFGEKTDALLLASQKVLPSELMKHRFVFDYPDVNSSLSSLYG